MLPPGLIEWARAHHEKVPIWPEQWSIARIKKRRVELAGKPLAFLEALARRPGAVVRRGAMERALWEHDHDLADPIGAAHKHALRVRDALEALGWPRSVIATVDEVGWCIDMDEVERVKREARGDGG
jgi:DNA-binding response OmpR family regulator